MDVLVWLVPLMLIVVVVAYKLTVTTEAPPDEPSPYDATKRPAH